MKSLTVVAALCMIFALKAQAQLVQPHYYYIHNESKARLDLVNIDHEKATAQYRDRSQGKLVPVSLFDVSKQTYGEIKGVKAGQMVLVKFQDQVLRPCEVWYVFENEMTHVGCQSGKMMGNIGVDRPELKTYPAHLDYIVREREALEGFNKSDKVRLMTDAKDLKQGDLVRIEHIFENGSAMVQKMGANLLDTSGLLMKGKVQVVELKDLELNK